MQRRRFLQLSAAALMTRSLIAAPPPARFVPWLAEVQTPPDPWPDDAPKLPPILVDADGNPIRTLQQWQQRREQLRQAWLDFLGHIPVDRSLPLTFEVLEEDHTAGVIRQRIRYDVQPGIATEAYLLFPNDRRQVRRPGVVVLHSTVKHSIRQPAGVEGVPEKAFGLDLARRGCVAICPRNFLWPTNDRIDARREAARHLERQPESTGMARMLLDAQRATDLLAALPEVDPQRLSCIGHSLGAKEVIYLAAFDERMLVTVSSEGGVGTTFSNWDDDWYLGPVIRQPDFQREHHELLALIAPRPFLLVGGDGADGDRSWPFIQAAMDVYRLYDQPVRLGLLNHRQGHAVPPAARDRMIEWMLAGLAPTNTD